MTKKTVWGALSASVAAAVMAVGLSATPAKALNYDLGFIMDQSGSISSANYNAAMNSLADALGSALAPTIGSGDTYTVAVVRFSSSATLVTKRTISDAGQLTSLVNEIKAAATGTGGTTCYSCAFDTLRNAFAGGLGNSSLVNMMTDGDPNVPADAFNAARAARVNLFNAGWDSLSFEAVGAGISDPGFLQELAYDSNDTLATLSQLQPVFNSPAQITNPLGDAFVLKVANFGTDYDAAINAKVQAIVSPVPIPGAAILLLTGLGGLGALRLRRKAA